MVGHASICVGASMSVESSDPKRVACTSTTVSTVCLCDTILEMWGHENPEMRLMYCDRRSLRLFLCVSLICVIEVHHYCRC